MNDTDTRKSKFEPVIGLEVHIQLNTKSKMFCGCSNVANDNEPNGVVCPVCFGMPGTLPVTNKQAVFKTFLFAKAVGAKISDNWNFERKNYFYPDLPKGYQITSSTNPPALGGEIKVIDSQNGEQFSVTLHHLHLEEDAGKLLHGKGGYSYVDLNRCGTPLIEMVTEPVIKTPTEAKMMLKELQILVRHLGISDADMEKGHMRCDANISLRLVGEVKFGKKVEVKNLNSFRMVERALNHEISRQEALLLKGEEIVQETRGWDDAKGATLSQRNKEDSQDYRYMPDPDLPPIRRLEVEEFSDENLTKQMPELPQAISNRLQSEFALTVMQAAQCVADSNFETLVVGVLTKVTKENETAKSLLFGDLLRIVNEKGLFFSDLKVTSDDLIEIVRLKEDGKLTQQIIKTNLEFLLTGKLTMMDLKKHGELSTSVDIDAIVSEVLSQNPKAVEQYKAGDAKVLGFLVGQVMAKSKGAANPQIANEKLKLHLV
jgi:aspartyl-tRNA(Asn)/glutamyl-tRNA(Gln) amidotransferase subunit B